MRGLFRFEGGFQTRMTHWDIPKPIPSVDQFDEMKNTWKARDKVAKVLGMFSSPRLFADWEIAMQDADARKNGYLDWL